MKDEAFKVVEQREEMEKVKAVEIDPLWVDVQVEVIDTFLLAAKKTQRRSDMVCVGACGGGNVNTPQYLGLISSKFLDNLS
jgi:hypothetical protein